MRCIRFLVATVAIVAASCSEPHELVQSPSTDGPSQATDDQAVVSVVPHDFAEWKEVTFGNRDGMLALDPFSTELSSQTLLDIRKLIRPISGEVSDKLIAAFLERNKSMATIAPLVVGSPWARIETSARDDEPFPKLPDWAKATGSLTMPGFNANRTQALIQISHSWSIHGAVITYVLSNRDGKWRIDAKDQAVFL